jgi:micrococcal nuclease
MFRFLHRCSRILIVALLTLVPITPVGQATAGDTVSVNVVSVIDGFTVRMIGPAGTEEALRLLGVSAPENPAPGLPPMCFGPESLARLTELVQGQAAMLEFDTYRQDRAGRVLGYLWLTDESGTQWLVNERLIAEGYARYLPSSNSLRYAERLAAAQESARNQGLGLWTACPEPTIPGSLPGSMPVPPDPGNPVPPTLLPGQPRVCDAAYPTICLPPPPPILTCEEIAERRFRVLPPDPHRLDPDQNGRGCED